MARNPFRPALLKFLRELSLHNERAWFERHREDYESLVREPALELIRLMAPHVRRISPHLTAVDKKAGGSLMRVHRDVRFSRSKLPYKTNVGIRFRHEAAKDVHAPGLYFHVEPESMFLGAGMWHPDADSLRAVREAIAAGPARWKRVRDAKRFRERWRLGGASLKRPPRGFPADHPMVEDLMRTDHIAICEMDERDVLSRDLIPRLAERYRRAAAYVRFQAEALGLDF